MKQEVKLGDKVRCILTGFTGTAVAKTEFINGCIQWGVLTKAGKDGKMPEEVGIDSQSLEVVKPEIKKQKKREYGGAMTRNLMRRNY